MNLKHLISNMLPITLSKGLKIATRIREKNGKRPHWYDVPIKFLAEYMGGDVKVADVTKEDIQGYYDWLLEKPNTKTGKPLSIRTVDSYLRATKAYFNLLEDAGHIKESPTRRFHLPSLPRKKPKDILPDDIEKMIRAAYTVRDEALVMVFRDTGGRLNAVANMTIDELYIELCENEEGGNFYRGRAYTYDDKIDEWVWIFFNDQTCRSLQRYLGTRPEYTNENRLWINVRGAAITASGIAQALKRIGKRIGIERWNPHAFRHAKVKRLVKNNAPHKVIQDLMNWKSEKMIQEYVIHRPDELQQYQANYDSED